MFPDLKPFTDTESVVIGVVFTLAFIAVILFVLRDAFRPANLSTQSAQEEPEDSAPEQLPYELGRETPKDQESWDRERRRRFVGRHQHRHCRRRRHKKV